MTQGQLYNSETQSQESAILQWLQNGNSITQLEALRRFQCLRLGARVFQLKKEGHDIQSEMIKVSGGKKRVASYKLKAD